MITKSMQVNMPQGLDPSTVALFIQIANMYESKVYVETEDKKINAKSLMGMMSLLLRKGEKIEVMADGEDEEKAIDHIEKYLNNEMQA
ncbi:MAG: HPr family phosphocarrier protein [Lachnospiraceae bacterium]|nr:HPr family phosphocarrier protein [Lachnospiraceae bacterium]